MASCGIALLLAIGLASGDPDSTPRSVRALLDAIRQVESGGRTDVVGDQGRSFGPYQIQREYWKDSGVPGRFSQVRHPSYAERVIVRYWQKYCPEALREGDLKTLARVHNGGPAGARKASTLKYWHRVRRELEAQRTTPVRPAARSGSS
jgi:hypothetical protein